MLPQLSLLVLRCYDVDESVAFYQALGLDFKAEKHGSGPEHFACQSDGFVFELYTAQEPNDAQSRLGFRVASLQAAAEALQSIGVPSQLKNSPWGTRLLTHDPDGRTVELSEPPAHQ